MEGRWDCSEFSHAKDAVYLDHAGTTLYAKSQLESYYKDLSNNLYGNPHSQNPSSKLTTETIEYVRDIVLAHFRTDSEHYDIIFTSGCTSSLHLLSDMFPWSGKSGCGMRKGDQGEACATNVLYINKSMLKRMDGIYQNASVPKGETTTTTSDNCQSVIEGLSVFCYLEDNHTSVVGMREIAADNGAQLVCVSEECVKGGGEDDGRTLGPNISLYHLFAYPAQSNFNGRKYPLKWVRQLPNKEVSISGLQNLKGVWLVLLDAAGYVSTNDLNLSENPAHFISISFYKIFGFPTGLGALLVRQDIGHLLKRRYFGGGTVVTSISRKRFHKPRPLLHERFEDGTVPFLDIIALRHGFESLNRFNLTMNIISQHTFTLAQHVYNTIVAMKHNNGKPLCVLYHDEDFADRSRQGGIVTFNLLRPDGRYVGYSEVDKMACIYNIHLRTGCFCNPGACQRYLDLTSEQILENMEAGHSCGDNLDLINSYPTGCVRISFGYMSTFNDAQVLVTFLKDCFLNMGDMNDTVSTLHYGDSLTLEKEILTKNTEYEHVTNSKLDSKVMSCVDADIKEQDTCTDVLQNNNELSLVTSNCNSVPIRMTDQSECDIVPDPHAMNIITGLSDQARTINDSKDDVMLHVGSLLRACLRSGDEVCYTLNQICLYPVKSCAAYQVKSWPVGTRGLKWDREWMIINERGACLSQKQEPRLSLIRPSIDLKTEMMSLTVTDPLIPDLIIPLHHDHVTSGKEFSICRAKVCGDKIQGIDCGDSSSHWLKQVLGRNCRLVQMNQNYQREAKNYIHDGNRSPVQKATLSLSNEAQYLMITQTSIKYIHELLLQRIGELSTPSQEDLVARFRPNLLVGVDKHHDGTTCTCTCSTPFLEDEWKIVKIGNATFQVVGGCSRCQMICVDQKSGIRSSEPLQTLLAVRGSKAKFGIYLLLDDQQLLRTES